MPSGFVRPVSLARAATAVFILGAALAGAAFLHHLGATPTHCPGLCAYGWKPPTHWRPWADPSAVAVLSVGVAGAVVVLLNARRNRS
jgi:hypothetical protein